ncbi:DNA-binding transcriptional regulator, CsgD family [Tranquillimonas rosea]|uniref:DNA-binding transcriptional regulator, CsgD family n=1 Tax=Tranquillimonas rosea TaxID=641238 RepID=A0A1H9WYQ7_9RHOB|nr:helix-turn-helix transcriptional regulator [Tranquillimonas rosea]SES39046.1 DNA-binding transcriptional regulator, CsgD family [Tranquillimonas rosea]
MSIIERSLFNTSEMVRSDALHDILGSLSRMSVACLDVAGGGLTVTSCATGAPTARAAAPAGEPGRLVEVAQIAGDPGALMGLAVDPAGGPAARWVILRCRFDSGIEDHVALHTDAAATAAAELLRTVWSGLRRMIVAQVGGALSDLSDDAMLWMISRRVNAAVLVLDAAGHVLKANTAARELLAEGTLLRAGPQGICAAREPETRALRAALAETAGASDPAKTEFVLILRGAGKTAHVPLSLSLYAPDGATAPLVLAMLPMPPEQKRIELLARRMGLTPTEARVAALMRAGHSNRTAAEIAGLKVETFNTYAKRVLSKMNVSCRAEMAQLLTWQASMERSL